MGSGRGAEGGGEGGRGGVEGYRLEIGRICWWGREVEGRWGRRRRVDMRGWGCGKVGEGRCPSGRERRRRM